MEEIILKALYSCALKYAKGFTRWQYLWQEKTTYEQQATAIAKDLEENGYVIIKRSDIKPLND